MTERRRPIARPASDFDWLRELIDERFATMRADAARQQTQLDQIQAHLAGRRDEMDRELAAIRTEFRTEVDKVKVSVGEIRDTIKTWAGAIAVLAAVVAPVVIELIRVVVFG